MYLCDILLRTFIVQWVHHFNTIHDSSWPHDFFICRNKNGDWSTKGCLTSNSSTDKEIICECSHLTNFAVIVHQVKFHKMILYIMTNVKQIMHSILTY